MIRASVRRLLIIFLSFCAGLIVFHLPERSYSSLPEVWLPVAGKNDRQAVLQLPVKTRPNISDGILFLPTFAGYPEIAQIDAERHGLDIKRCPSLHGIHAAKPEPCKKVGSIAGSDIYAVRRIQQSKNVEVFMKRGKTLIAVTGFIGEKDAIAYLKRFTKVARRDVNRKLGHNRDEVIALTTVIRKEKEANLKERREAYRHLPFVPLLPATLPAGWIQYSVKISGADPTKPNGVHILYKKGRDRFVGLTLVPRDGFALGPTCGPTADANDAYLPCSKVSGKDYFAAGVNGTDYVSWYIYWPIGDVVAVVHASAYSQPGQPLLLSNQDATAQEEIARSLHPVDIERLKDSRFIGVKYDPYPNIQP